MFPRLFSIGHFTLHTYGLLVATGFLLGIYVAQKLAKQFGLNPDLVFNLAVYVAFAAVVGSKVFLVIQDWRFYWHNPAALVSTEFLQSAGIFYGGLVFGLLTLTLYVRHHKMRWLAVGDCLAPGAALGHAIGRLGCFSAGCCWGKPTNASWGVIFTSQYAHQTVGVPLGVRLYPTQLIESGAEFIIFGILMWIARRRGFSGELTSFYLVVYGIVRYLVDFLRVYEPQAMLFHGLMTDAQLTSLFMIALGIGIWMRQGRRRTVLSNVPA